MSNIHSVYTLLQNLEQAALKSADAKVQAFGTAMSASLTAFRAAVPGLAAQMVNAGIAELARVEPVFGLLVPAEVVIDPAVSGLVATFEGMLLHGGAGNAGGAPAEP